MKLLNNPRLRWPVYLRWYHTALAVVWTLTILAGGSIRGPIELVSAFLATLIVISILTWIYRKGRALAGRGTTPESA